MIGYEVVDMAENKVIASADADSLQVKDRVVVFIRSGDVVGVIMLTDQRYVRVIARVKEAVNAAR